MNKSYYKSELAEMADVSYSTFSRFLRTHRKALERLGSSAKSHILRGKALEYVCREFDIDLPEEELSTAKKHEKFRERYTCWQ